MIETLKSKMNRPKKVDFKYKKINIIFYYLILDKKQLEIQNHI